MNKETIVEEMAEIPLTKGKVALVDAQHYDYLVQWKWCAMESRKTYYAVRTCRKGEKRRAVLMHREIMDAPKDMTVDHIDHDGLNNTLSNLRLSDSYGNRRNKSMQCNSTSGFKGVSKHAGRWAASICVNDRAKFLGRYNTREEAARAYDEAAVKYFGEFALTNKMLGLL